MLWLCQFYLSAWVVQKKYVELVWHANPCIHNSENRMFLELSLFISIPTIVIQLIVRSTCASVSINAYYSCGPSTHSIPEWLGETSSSTSSISKIGSKQLYSADQMQSSFWFYSTLKYYPLCVKNIVRIAPSLMNSWCSDTSCHHFSFLGPVLSQPKCRQVNYDVWNKYS